MIKDIITIIVGLLFLLLIPTVFVVRIWEGSNEPRKYVDITYCVYYPNNIDTVHVSYNNPLDYTPTQDAKWGRNRIKLGGKEVITTTAPLQLLHYNKY